KNSDTTPSNVYAVLRAAASCANTFAHTERMHAPSGGRAAPPRNANTAIAQVDACARAHAITAITASELARVEGISTAGCPKRSTSRPWIGARNPAPIAHAALAAPAWAN